MPGGTERHKTTLISVVERDLLYEVVSGLSTISSSDYILLKKLGVRQELSKGDILLQQGKVCSSIFFVEQGFLRTYIDRDGTEVNTDFTFEGSFVTSLKSLRTASPSDCSIDAGEKTVIYRFQKEELVNLYAVSQQIESFGRKLLEKLLIDREEHSNLFKIYSPAERYRYLQENRPDMIQRLSLSQIASFLGVARETLSRIRAKKD